MVESDALEIVNTTVGNCNDTAAIVTSVFDALSDEYLVPGTAECTKTELRDARKGELSIGTFAACLVKINSFLPFMPPPQNVSCPQSELKTILIRAMPDSWQHGLTRSGNEHSYTFCQTIVYFKELEHSFPRLL